MGGDRRDYNFEDPTSLLGQGYSDYSTMYVEGCNTEDSTGEIVTDLMYMYSRYVKMLGVVSAVFVAISTIIYLFF